MILQTKRCILRPWCEDDAEDLYKYASDPDVGPAAGWPVHKSIDESLKIIRTVLSFPKTFAVCLKEDGRAIGCVGLHRNDLAECDGEFELGYWLGKPFWGRGIIPEVSREILRYAFEELGMERIWCGYYDGNVKSKRVQEKLGFKYHHTTEGIEVKLLGEIRTGHANLLLRKDWEKSRKTEEYTEENMKRVLEFLKRAQVYYLATVDIDQPRVRPFGTVNEFEGKLYIQTGKVKPVSRQLAQNNKAEICAFSDGEWVRVCCELVEDDSFEARKSMLDAYPDLRGMYDENDGNTQVLYMKNATATFSSFGKDSETVEF